MNTPNPSEAREIAKEINEHLNFIPIPTGERHQNWVRKSVQLLRKAISLLTHPTSTPPDAGDSAKLVSDADIDALAIRFEDCWRSCDTRTAIREVILPYIEQHATPADGAEALRNCLYHTRHASDAMTEVRIPDNITERAMNVYDEEIRAVYPSLYGRMRCKFHPMRLALEDFAANYIEQHATPSSATPPENWQCEHVAYGKYIDDQTVVSCGASEPDAFKLYSCDSAPSSATSEAVAWQARINENDMWFSVPSAATATAYENVGYEIRPLYASPHPIERQAGEFSKFDELVAELERDNPQMMAEAREWAKKVCAEMKSIPTQAGEFVSVPREPTTEMIYAGIEAMKKAPDLVGIVDNLLPEAVDCYKAMLAAAPAQAAQGDV